MFKNLLLKRQKKFLKPFIRPKSFTKKVDLNLNLARLNFIANNSLVLSRSSNLKIFCNIFLRRLKLYKTASNFDLVKEDLGSKLQIIGFYSSNIEINKSNKIKILRCKILDTKNCKIVQELFNGSSYLDSFKFDQKNLNNLSFGLDKLDKFYGDYSNTLEKRQVFLKVLKSKRFFSNIFLSRLFLFAASGRKRYKNVFSYMMKKRRKINSLFHVYTFSSLKFKDLKKQRKRLLKRLAWKIKKQKKWKRRNVFSLFRLRQKLSQVFYVPGHFEVNYKTFTANYLGYTDTKTINTKIAFWLNLRKLLTFLS